MKLLLDENVSDRIIYRIIDLYPNSGHVKTLALINTDDADNLIAIVQDTINVFYPTDFISV